MTEFVAIFLASFGSSAHCIGMCGGFAAAIGATEQPFWPTFGRQLVYSAGRITTYAFLGAVGGTAGLYLSRIRLPLMNSHQMTAQQLLSVLAGVVMLYVGLNVLGVIRFRRRGSAGGQSLLAPVFTHFLNARGMWGNYSAGLATGFLPCGLVYGALALAAATGNMVNAMLLMICFGLGTVPAMVAVGCGSRVLSYGARAKVYKLAACFVILLGAVTIYRGWPSRAGSCCSHATASLDRTHMAAFMSLRQSF